MQVEITKDLEDYFIEAYGIKKGDVLDVIFKPNEFTNNKGVTKTGYMIYNNIGRAIVVYDDEVKVIN